MTILFLAPRLPVPADTGGKIRTWNILKQVSRFAKVHLVCFSFDPQDEKYVLELEKQEIAVTLVPCPRANFFQKATGVLFNPRPYSIAKYDTELMRQAITDLLAKEKFDLVHVDHLHMAHYCELFDVSKSSQSGGQEVNRSKVELSPLSAICYSLPAILDDHNVEYKILERGGNVQQVWWKKFIYIQQAAKTKKFEQLAVSKFNVVTAVSDDDANILRDLSGGKAKVEVLPNGVDCEYFSSRVSELASFPGFKPANPPTRQLDENNSIVFTGSLDWLPNDDAVRYFISEILPLIWQTNPNVKFYVVGKSPSAVLQKLAGEVNGSQSHKVTMSQGGITCDSVTCDPVTPISNPATGNRQVSSPPLNGEGQGEGRGDSPTANTQPATGNRQQANASSRIVVTDRVPDVRPYMSDAKVFVVPLRIGGGTRLKILEAMSFGIPVVSTSIGAEGIAYTNDKDIVIADDPQAFADAVLSLLKDEGRRARLAVEGRRLVMERYDWGIIGKKLKEIYTKMLAS